MIAEYTDRDKEIERQAMKIFQQWPRTQIIFGAGTLKTAGKYAAKYGKKALVVIGGGSVKENGILEILLASLERRRSFYSNF